MNLDLKKMKLTIDNKKDDEIVVKPLENDLGAVLIYQGKYYYWTLEQVRQVLTCLQQL